MVDHRVMKTSVSQLDPKAAAACVAQTVRTERKRRTECAFSGGKFICTV